MKVPSKICATQSSKKDSTPKRRIYKVIYESQSLKTYGHVGMADNHQRLRSDEIQTKNDEKSVIKDHKA